MQSLKEIMDQLPQEYINSIIACGDTAILNEMLKKTKCPDKRVVINARIANINYLIA